MSDAQGEARQRGRISTTRQETNQYLLLDPDASVSDEEKQEEGDDVELLDSPTKKLKQMEKEDAEEAEALCLEMDLNDQAVSLGDFIYLHYIGGSTASVEHCFSIAKYILSDVLMGMSPYLFECFMFLHLNMDMWGAEKVKQAIYSPQHTNRDNEDATKHLFSNRVRNFLFKNVLCSI
jgi:hypothetical protein